MAAINDPELPVTEEIAANVYECAQHLTHISNLIGMTCENSGRIATALETIAEKLPSKRELAAMRLLMAGEFDGTEFRSAIDSAEALLAELAKEKPDA